MSTGERFERVVSIMARLRGPDGCPWDREQTFDSIKPYTLEETYEVLDAIDNRDWTELKIELGDLLLQVLFYAEMANEAGSFGIEDVLECLSEKLVSRHPHVFGDVKAETPKEVLVHWEAIKRQEKATAREKSKSGKSESVSLLDGIPAAMPALMEGYKLSSRAANAGFDWPDIAGVLDKVKEEIAELEHEIGQYPAPGPSPHSRGIAGSTGRKVPVELQERLQDEVGDLLFTVVNVARYLSVDPEQSLRLSNRKFKRRFQAMEAKLNRQGQEIRKLTPEELESRWRDVKRKERGE